MFKKLIPSGLLNLLDNLFLDIHPLDAEDRNIKEGDEVRVFNHRGAVVIKSRISDRNLPGIVSMPFGFWPSLLPGSSSANALTRDGFTDRGEGSDCQDTRVEITKNIT